MYFDTFAACELFHPTLRNVSASTSALHNSLSNLYHRCWTSHAQRLRLHGMSYRKLCHVVDHICQYMRLHTDIYPSRFRTVSAYPRVCIFTAVFGADKLSAGQANDALLCAMQLLGLKSFRTGAVMLAGLLLYDVFWVFGSPSVIGDNVMLTVATSDIVSGPTRLLFPRMAGGTGEASNFPFSLLGDPPTSATCKSAHALSIKCCMRIMWYGWLMLYSMQGNLQTIVAIVRHW